MFTRWLAALFLFLPVFATATELARALQSPHYVLLMRHAYAPGVGDPPNYSLERCEGQRLLNDEGKRQATRTGDWLRQQGLTPPEKPTGLARLRGKAKQLLKKIVPRKKVSS